MTTTDDERCCRIYLMLFNGGTKISKALFEKCMKGQTPEYHIPHPWTLDHFLRANKTKILGTKTGRVEQRKIFPARGASTQVEEWDLNMYCFFLIEIIDVECRLRMDIKQLRKIRNKICHQNEPNIEIEKYNRTVDKLEVIYERLLKEICDEELTIEVNRIFKASKEDPLSTKEIIFALHKFYKTDLETREILTQQNAETREILTQQNAELSCNVKTLMKKMDDIDKKQNLMLSCGLVDCEFENCTETCVELRIKNCPSCTERFISKALVSMYKKETGQPSNEQLSLSEEKRTELMAAVKDTVASFASKKRPIIDAEQNCVILLIKCSTVNSLLSLFYDCINGDLNKEFQKLESAVRQIKGLEEVSLEAVLYMDEFYRTMQRTVSAFDESVTRAYGNYLQNRGQRQTENTYGITDIRLVERQLPEDDLSDNCNESKDEDLLSDKSEVHSSPYLSDSECAQSFEHDETGVSNQNSCLKTDPTSEAVTQLEYTTKMDQQADNKIEEDLCEMGENILDYKKLSEEKKVSHSPLYLHSQQKVKIDSEIFTNPLRMFLSTDSRRHASCLLSEVLDDIGINEKMIMRARRVFMLMETINNIILKSIGYNTEDDHIVGDNISAKDDLSDNCNESNDEDLLSKKSEVHSSPFLSDSECEQSFEHDETGVSNQNSCLKTDPTSEADTQLENTTKMDQQADNKIEEDLCEMGENILDYKHLSEKKKVSHSPLYLHSQPKVRKDSEIFTNPLRMFLSTDRRRHVSFLLSEVLDDIGINEKMIMRARRVVMLMETMNNITLKSVGYNIVSYNLGSRCEGTTTLGLMSDIDQLFCMGYFNVIQDWSEWEHGKENYIMMEDENTTPGYCFLMLLRHDVPLPATSIPNKYHVTDKRGRILLRNTMIGDITPNGPAMAIQTQQGHSDTDIIVGLPCKSWPKSAASGWLERQGIGKWPSQKIRRHAASLGCFVVPTGSKVSLYPDLEWRISTPLAERCLMFDLNITQIKCYVLMKMVLKTFLNHEGEINISSFMCKTVLLHCIENKEPRLWKEDTLLECLGDCFMELHRCVQNSCLSHFIIPGNNLIEGQFTIKTKHQLLRNFRDFIQNDVALLLRIDIDDLGPRLQVKLNLVPETKYNLYSSLHVREHVAADKNLSFLMMCNNNYFFHLKTFHNKDIGIVKQTVERLMTCNNNDDNLEHAAFTFLAPLLSSTYGSALASASIGLKYQISPQALVWLINGFESDFSSGRLKLALVFYNTGDMEKTELILRHTESQYHSYPVVSICGCWKPMHLPKVTAEFASVYNEHMGECVINITAFCVRYVQQEMNCVPHELQYEMFRSTQYDMQHRDQDEDFWMDFAVVDSLAFLYFLQYKVYRHLQRYQDQQLALNKLANTIKTDSTLRHKETALNLLGQCMEQENRPSLALHCYLLSLKQRARNNAAKIHICRLLSSLLAN